jgi:hypothetical protein
MYQDARINALCKRAGRKNARPAVRQLVRGLHRKYGPSDPPYDVNRFCEIANVVIESSPLTDSDACLVRAADGWIARVSPDLSKARRDFAVCHEIGHTFFEPFDARVPEPRHRCEFATYGRTANEEILCDYAAAEMLMPKQVFSNLVRNRKPSMESVWQIAHEFGASIQAVIARIIDLDLWEALSVRFGVQETVLSEFSFNLSHWRSSASAFRSYMRPEDLVYFLRGLAREPVSAESLGLYEAYSRTSRYALAEFSIKPLDKYFLAFSYRIEARNASAVTSLIVRA